MLYSRRVAADEPSLAEHVCLALVAEGAAHGWAIGSLLAHDGDIGHIWTLSRPLTYRAIDGLVARKLLKRSAHESGPGRDRVVLAMTRPGRSENDRWLAQPIEHLRDVRTELLVKLTLLERSGADTRPLLIAQRAHFADLLDSLTSASADDDLVQLWRAESARAARRFLDRAIDPAVVSTIAPAAPELRLSARNQLRGVVTGVTHSEIMSTVKMVLPDGQRLNASITREATTDLDVAPGDNVIAIIKSTTVMIAKPD
ncbi:unannotated protein [freshwater metagenome]|uniref:Unannotated protein n=1 Tax=freshwater metagenome TaxID=449393 RepID=A0A6J7ECG5_9ZZZZ|nr:hypothetical protein [Actinomycetota bacterium]